MTLKELAIELRKVFEFRYLTIESHSGIYAYSGQKPEYSKNLDCWMCDFSKTSIVFRTNLSVISLDISEYMDEDGNIDYSKCIVEVV